MAINQTSSDLNLSSRTAAPPETSSRSSAGSPPPPHWGETAVSLNSLRETTQPAEAAPAPRTRDDLWALLGCNCVVFIASICIMVVELTASRLIANYVGNSLYTWTSVIGVVLAGISVGNYLGGRLADKYPPQKTLAWLFLISGLLTFSVLFLNNLAATTARPAGVSWPLWVMLVVACVFLLPALSLGTISPVTASMALKRSARTGVTVGNLYAWGAVGSIVGTFLTGFWLIDHFGSRQVICITSAVLVLMGALVASGQKIFRTVGLIGVIPMIAHYGALSSVTGAQMSDMMRAIAGVRSGWSTSPAEFAADQAAIDAAAKKRDRPAWQAARSTQAWRQERKTAEDGWGQWGERLGGQLHSLGMTLSLRRDDPSQYHDESSYFSINVSTSRSGDEVVKTLSLDHLIHSYYNPRFPAKLYYEYEMIYAAVTERAAEMAVRPTAVPLATAPSDEMREAFPREVFYDPGSSELVISGPMTFEQLRGLLSIGPQAEFWQAAFAVWDESNGNSTGAASRIGGVITSPLSKLPRGITIPASLATRLRHDRGLKSLVCMAPFTLDELWGLLAQGEMREYVEAVRRLYLLSRSTSALFVGGGGYIFPRWMEANFPNEPRIDVAEIDGAVQAVAERELGLPTEYGPPAEGKTYIRTHVGDARTFVDDRLRENAKRKAAGEAEVTYDFIYGDAFNDLSVPWHLTTLEYSTAISKLLTPKEGVYLVNLIDIYPRVEFPPKPQTVPVATVDCSAEIPAALLPEEIPAGKFVSCGSEFAGLEIARLAKGYRLRYQGVMPKELGESLVRLDERHAEAADSDGFAAVVAKLYSQTHTRPLLKQQLPAEWLPAQSLEEVWQPAPAPFEGLQVQQYRDAGSVLGFRGVMSDEQRNRLLENAGDDQELKTAVLDLCRKSREEQVGQFLGRYLNTVRQVFPYVYVFTSNADGPQASRDTFVVVCSLKDLALEQGLAGSAHWKQGPFAWSVPGPSQEPASFG